MTALHDGRAKLYELTQNKTFSLAGDPNYAINSNRLSGPCFGKGGDFCMNDTALETGSCNVGGSFGFTDDDAAGRIGADGMEAESLEIQATLDLCGIERGWGVVAFQAWIVKDFNQHVLTGQDMAWLDSELPGATVAEAKVCYDLAMDDGRNMTGFLAGCGDMEGHALMIVAELTTNKKVVGFTLRGFNHDGDGDMMRRDNFANLFEVTGRTRLVLEDPERAVGLQHGGGLVFGAGPDFAIHRNFHDVDCEIGTSYTSPEKLTALALKKLLCGVHHDGGAAKLTRFEAWLVPFNTPDESLTKDENKWLSSTLGGDIPLSKSTSCYSTNFFDASRSSKALRAACAGPLKPGEMMVLVSTLNTGRKVVVVSSKGVTKPSAGWTTDPFVSLYEVTQRLGPCHPNTQMVGVYGSPAGAANRVAFGVVEGSDFADFMLEESLSSGTCFVGEGVGDYRIKSVWINGTAESYKLCGNSAFSVLKFEAFIVAKPHAPLLGAEELRWLAAASTCKNCASASKRTVCTAYTYADAKGAWDSKACAALDKGGGKRLLVVAAALSSGKKVVALTYKGFADANGGNVSDPLAQLYEVTSGSAFPLKNAEANLRMDAASISFGDDFVLNRDLSTGRSTIGSSFGMQTGVDAQHLLTGSSDGNFSVLRVEAWLVDINEVEAITAEEEAWLGKALGYVDLNQKKTCFDADMTGASNAGYQKSVLAFNLYCPMNLAREDIARVEDQYNLNLTATHNFDWDDDMVVGVAVTSTGKKIAFKQYPGDFGIKGGNSLTALYEVTAGVTFLPANAALGATKPPNSLAQTDSLSLPNMEMQIAHDFSSGTMFKHGWGYYATAKDPSGANAAAAAAADDDAPDVPCTKTDALCYGNRDPELINSVGPQINGTRTSSACLTKCLCEPTRDVSIPGDLTTCYYSCVYRYSTTRCARACSAPR